MELNLTRPIIFFDLEATGINITRDKIVEISYIKVFPDGKEESKTMRLNPEIPIPRESTAVHHITNDDVKDAPRFEDVAKDLAKVFDGCDVAGFNSNRFDVPMLEQQFLSAGVDFDFSKCKFIDVQTIFHKMEQRNLVAAYKFYCGKDLSDAHSASGDTHATYEVLKSQLDRYPDLQNNVDFLSKFSSQNRNLDLAGRMIYNDKDEPVFNFGKYKGKPVAEILKRDTGYYGWMMQADFPIDTKRVLTRLWLATKDGKTTI